MCFSGEMSAFFALSSIAMAATIYRRHRNIKFGIAILYFGLMEGLQAVQYIFLAEPDDGFSMCKNPTNQFLTMLGFLHICFQPFFCNMINLALPRQHNLQDRFQNDIIQRISFVGGLWLFSRYLIAIYWPDNPGMFGPATEACPNYEFITDGYDAGIGWTTPNVPGHSCTFRANTKTAHLAWALPMHQATYFVPGASLHAFLMFVPTLVVYKRWHSALGNLVTGPLLAIFLTKSMNEQAAVWCFFSMFQCLILSTVSWFKPTDRLPEDKIVHEGGIGEKPLEYMYVATHSTKKLHSN